MIQVIMLIYNLGQEKDEHEEYQYLNLIQNIIEKGVVKHTRPGIDTLSLFGAQMRFSLKDYTFPLLTTKKLFYRGIVEELLWFIKGSTNAKELQDKNVHIWTEHSSREYLDSIGLTQYPLNDLGPIYGFQWRHFGAKYVNCFTDYKNQGFDQLLHVINTIKNNPHDRRIIMCAWNPLDIPLMALPPCHCLVQFYVAEDKLSCHLYQRSADLGLGVPFNIASYALLTHLIAHVTGLKPGDFIHTLGDAHIYVNHLESLKIQLKRKPRPFPTLTINEKVNDIEQIRWEDIHLNGYYPHEKIDMPLAV